MAGASERKAELRAHLRHVRRQVDDPADRSERIWEVVRGLDEVAGAGVVMAFASIRGEPDTAAFVDWCTAAGKTVVLPEDEPDPALPDVVVVPAVGGAYPEFCSLFTVDMHVSYLEPVREEDAVAEGWVEKRGRSTVFCRTEIRTPTGRLVTTGSLIYRVGSPIAPWW